MIERLFALLERFVAAAETLAANHHILTATAPLAPAAPAAAPAAAPVNDPAAKYRALSLDTLKQLAQNRGVEFPPRTRAETYVAKLVELDALGAEPAFENGEKMPSVPETTAAAAPAVPETTAAADPFAQPAATTPAEDPFGEIPPRPITEAEVRARLQEVMKTFGTEGVAKVTEILQKVAGVAKVTLLPAEKYSAVLEATNYVLKH